MPSFSNPWFIAFAIGAGTLVAGCSGPSDLTDRSAEGSRSRLRVSLVTDGGGTYRLSHALFEVESTQPGGPTVTLESDTDPDATVLSAELLQGSYSIELQAGWVLERLEDTGYVAVPAALVSPNPREFQIRHERTTALSYVFTTDDGIVRLGQGALDVGIAVVDTGSLPSTCSVLDPNSCGSGQSCLLANEEGGTFCADAGTLPEGAACDVQQCVAGAQCLRLDPDAPDAGTCRRFCEPAAPPFDCYCQGLAASPELGVCLPPSGLTRETIPLVSDGSWLTYPAASWELPPSGWNTPAFDDWAWSPSRAPNPGQCSGDGTHAPVRDWERPASSMWDASDQYSSFFRKVVTLPEHATVQRALVTVWADDDIALWVNGAEVYVEPDFGIFWGNTIIQQDLDLTPFLLPGANLIAIHGQDTVGGCREVVVSGSIDVLYPSSP